MKRFSKVSFDDIKTIQVDSGVLLKEFDVENPVFLPENVICATSGGINPVCAPEYYDFGEDVDNAKTAKETKRIRGWNVSISFTTFTTSLDLIRFALGAADISGKVLNIRQKLQYAKDFKDIWWVGKRADDKLIAIRLIRSLSDSGFSLQTNKRGKGQISVTLKGHSSFTDIKKVPMEIYVFAESDIPVTPDEPVTSEMYLYGTPSSTGNIGLRNGESVTYYDGVVAPDIYSVYTPELQAAFPFAHIVKIVDSSTNAVKYWQLYLEKTEPYTFYLDNFNTRVFHGVKNGEATSTYWLYRTNDEGTSWESIYQKPMTGVHSSLLTNVVWANYNVKDIDGGQYKPASEPIPVSGLIGYKCGEWEVPMFDIAEYPYVHVLQDQHSDDTYAVVVTDREMTYENYGGYIQNCIDAIDDSSLTKFREATLKSSGVMVDNPEWEVINTTGTIDGTTSGAIGGTLIWSNYKLTSNDGLVTPEASEPIPVYE